jgi:hypothetical protein
MRITRANRHPGLTGTKLLVVLILIIASVVWADVDKAGAQTCHGGPRDGFFCTNSYDCAACASGPYTGMSCRAQSECGETCEGGPYHGSWCTGQSQCGKACADTGSSCVYSWQCPGSYCRSFECNVHECNSQTYQCY